MESERPIMVGQAAVMFAVLFLVTWLAGLHWLLAVLVALLLAAPVLIAIEGVRHYFESRAKRDEEGEEETATGGEGEGGPSRERAGSAPERESSQEDSERQEPSQRQ